MKHMMNHQEYDDLQIILELFKEKNVKPLFISVPVNGPWYDYTGFRKNAVKCIIKKFENRLRKQDIQ